MPLLFLLLLLTWASPALAVITASNLTTSGVNSPGTSEATASITPSPNTLVLACVMSEVTAGNTPNTPTLTGNGMTWVEVESHNQGTSRHTMFRAMDVSPAVGTVTMDFAGQSQTSMAWSVFEIANVDTGGTNGSIALVQAAANGQANSLGVVATLASFFTSANGTIGCGGSNDNIVLTPGTDFTQVAQHSGTGTRMLSQYRTDSDTTVNVTGASTSTLIVIGAEICAAPAATTTKDDGEIYGFIRWMITPLLAWAAACPENDVSPLAVFPGAEGFASQSVGGRGGIVYKVTNLNSSGAGSFADCALKTHKRTCIFEVSGKIPMGGLTISSPYISVYGQTAPDPGIAFTGQLNIGGPNLHDVLIQHVQIRHITDTIDNGCLAIENGSYNVVIDHVSTSWSVDTCVSIFDFSSTSRTTSTIHDITVSNSIISEALDDSEHHEGGQQQTHSMGMMTGGSPGNVPGPTNIAILKNLFAHNISSRNPYASGTGTIANNLIYNYGGQAITFRNTHPTAETARWSVVGNKAIKGPDWDPNGNKMVLFNSQFTDPDGRFYLFDNQASGFTSGSAAYGSTPLVPWSFVSNDSGIPNATLTSATAVAWPPGYEALAGTATEAYVLANAGSRPKTPATRNATDERIVAEVIARTGGNKDCVSTCDEGSDVQVSFESMANNSRPLTVPANDTGDSDGDGYTNLEEWVHDNYTSAVQ